MIERGMDACVWFVQVPARGAWMFAEILIYREGHAEFFWR
jgi:hypothetical protein